MVDYELIEKHFNTAKIAIESEKANSKRCRSPSKFIQNNNFGMNDDTFNELVNRVLSIVPVSLEPAMTLSKPSPKWFTESRADRGSKRFDAYEQYLQNVLGYSSNVVTTIGNSMDTIMNNIGDPTFEGEFVKKV